MWCALISDCQYYIYTICIQICINSTILIQAHIFTNLHYSWHANNLSCILPFGLYLGISQANQSPTRGPVGKGSFQSPPLRNRPPNLNCILSILSTHVATHAALKRHSHLDCTDHFGQSQWWEWSVRRQSANNSRSTCLESLPYLSCWVKNSHNITAMRTGGGHQKQPSTAPVNILLSSSWPSLNPSHKPETMYLLHFIVFTLLVFNAWAEMDVSDYELSLGDSAPGKCLAAGGGWESPSRTHSFKSLQEVIGHPRFGRSNSAL